MRHDPPSDPPPMWLAPAPGTPCMAGLDGVQQPAQDACMGSGRSCADAPVASFLEQAAVHRPEAVCTL